MKENQAVKENNIQLCNMQEEKRKSRKRQRLVAVVKEDLQRVGMTEENARGEMEMISCSNS